MSMHACVCMHANGVTRLMQIVRVVKVSHTKISGTSPFLLFALNNDYFWYLFCTDVMDYSGMQLRYVDEQRTFDAGVLEVGHQVTEDMVVPPRSTSFSIFGVCNETCTAAVSKFFTVCSNTNSYVWRVYW